MFASDIVNFVDRNKAMKNSFRGFFGLEGGSTQGYFSQQTYSGKLEAVILNPKIDSDKAGGHWILFARHRRALIYFDPLGRPPSHYSSSAYWKRLEASGRLVSNIGCQYQAEDSARCGLYVLYVLFFLSKGYKFSRIMNKFSLSHRSKNEDLVLRFYNSKNFRRRYIKHSSDF